MLPIYKYVLKEDSDGMDFIAIVDNPAHMKRDVLLFNDQKPKEFKQYFDSESKTLMAVAIATEVPIYRRDKELGEHYGVFDKADVKKIWYRMMKSNFMHNVNDMHDENKVVEGMTLVHSYPVDEAKGIFAPTQFKNQNLKDGSIIAFYEVTDPSVVARIQNGEIQGLSIEGWFDKVELKIKKTIMSKEKSKIDLLIEGLKDVFSGKVEFAEATTVDGITVFWEGELATGIELKVKGEDGTEILAPEGMHAIAGEGEEDPVTVITVDGNGIISNIETEEVTTEEGGEETELDIDAVLTAIQGLFKSQKVAFDKEIVKLRAENKKVFDFAKEVADKDDKKKFKNKPNVKSFEDLINQ